MTFASKLRLHFHQWSSKSQVWLAVLGQRKIPWMWLTVLGYLGFILVLPITVLILYSSQALPFDFWRLATAPKALSAYQVTLSLAFFAALVNGFFGFLVAWVFGAFIIFQVKNLLIRLSTFRLRYQRLWPV